MNSNSTPEIQQLIAARAMIVRDKKVLIIRESSKYVEGTNVGRYDVPGGRVRVDEAIQESLVREVKEEVGLDITIEKPFFVGEWRPVIKGERLQIIGVFFLCSADGDVRLSEDHDDFQWVARDELSHFNILEPIPDAIQTLASGGVL